MMAKTKYNEQSQNQKETIKISDLRRIIKKCFWDYNFLENDIVDILKSSDLRKKAFLFEKILLNSTRLFHDLKIFDKNELKLLLDEYKLPNFNRDAFYRYKDVVIPKKGYLIDNIENILSNKITAVMGRDDPKDIFDIYLIAKFYTFSWKDILESAHKKAYFSDEEFIIRLKTFPPELLKKIKLIDRHFLDNFNKEFKKIIDKIENKAYNHP